MVRPSRTQYVVNLLGDEIDWRAYAEALEDYLDDGRPDDPADGQTRREDPPTSKKAAQRNPGNTGSQRGQVFRAIARCPNGAIPDELVGATGIDYRSLTPRLGELEAGDWIMKLPGVSREGAKGEQQAVRVLTLRGFDWLDGREFTPAHEPGYLHISRENQ